MARLLRPAIPVEVKCLVALRQLGEMWPDRVVAEHHRRLGALLESLLVRLAALLNCPREQLHLDHDPALENRVKIYESDGRGEPLRHVDYQPAANDPEWLFYRPYGAEFAGSHKIKTLVRGDHGQHSDAALARKLKRIAKKKAGLASNSRVKLRSAKRKWPKRPFPKGRGFGGKKP